jgi:hypothetical protein
MHYKYVQYILAFILLNVPLASVFSNPFSGLKEVNGIFYNPKLATPITKKSNIMDSQSILIMQAPFNAKQKLVVSLADIGSDYVGLLITERGSGDQLIGKELGMINLGATGKAKVYLRGGHAIYMEKEGISSKYKLTKKGVKEVRQPFVYLGHKTQVKIPTDTLCGSYKGPKKLQLLGQKKAGSYVVATLKAGSKIEVILKDDDWYLIKSPFGLIGWAKNTSFYHSLFGFHESCVG